MSVSKKSNKNIKKAAAYGFSWLCGAAVSGLVLAALTGLMYILGLPPEVAGVLSSLALMAGSFVCGLICGLIKRKNGLRAGVICTLITLTAAIPISLISGGFTGSSLVVKALAVLISACTGSVLGVNYAFKHGLRR